MKPKPSKAWTRRLQAWRSAGKRVTSSYTISIEIMCRKSNFCLLLKKGQKLLWSSLQHSYDFSTDRKRSLSKSMKTIHLQSISIKNWLLTLSPTEIDNHNTFLSASTVSKLTDRCRCRDGATDQCNSPDKWDSKLPQEEMVITSH